MASAERALIIGFHFPFPAIAHVEKKDEAGYRLCQWPGTRCREADLVGRTNKADPEANEPAASLMIWLALRGGFVGRPERTRAAIQCVADE